MPHFNFMDYVNINIIDCELEYYKYYLKGNLKNKKNFIPIFVLKLPFKHDSLTGKYVRLFYSNGEPFNQGDILNSGGITLQHFSNVLPTLIPTWIESKANKNGDTYTYNHSYLAFEYEDDFFKISVRKAEDFETPYQSAILSCHPKYKSEVLNSSDTTTPLLGCYVNPPSHNHAYNCFIVSVVMTSDYKGVLAQNPKAYFIHGIKGDIQSLYGFTTDIIASDFLKPGVSKGSINTDYGLFYTGSGTITMHDTSFTRWAQTLINKAVKTDIIDPNPGGGDSKPGGGGGDGDIGGDTNPDDGLPTISALDSGLLTAYNPSVKNLQDLGKFLWSDGFDVSTFKKLFNDPFDTLLGLSVVPVIPNTSGTKNIMFGNMDSGVSAPVVANQWVKKDMGSVTLNEVWRGALDYAPSTGVTIYLPFIGMRQLNVNDVMGSTLHLIYKFDVLTGACVAQIYVNHNHQGNKDSGFSWTANQGLVYEFIGQCAENIPLASQDFTNTIRAAIGGVSVAAGAAASVATGNPALGMAALTVGMANAGMQASTPTVERGGHLSGSASIMGYSQPFLIVERPHQCKPSRYYALRGVPSQVYTSKLASCTGFTQITANNNLHIAGASDTELAELQNLLVAGVYFPDKKR